MAGFLFDKIIFGPIHSRRLGLSLGVNLLPVDYKYCTFNCIYCECGWTTKGKGDIHFPTPEIVKQYLDEKLSAMQAQGQIPDAITFAGNGEPTLHPRFLDIIDNTIALRNKYFPTAKVCVLSNATRLHFPKVLEALKKTDIAMLKLDAGNEELFNKINKPAGNLSLNAIVDGMMQLQGKLIIQSLFLKGTSQGELIDNTTDENVSNWLEILKKLKPQKVIIYPVERATPAETLEIVDKNTLEKIAEKVRAAGFIAEVY